MPSREMDFNWLLDLIMCTVIEWEGLTCAKFHVWCKILEIQDTENVGNCHFLNKDIEVANQKYQPFNWSFKTRIIYSYL